MSTLPPDTDFGEGDAEAHGLGDAPSDADEGYVAPAAVTHLLGMTGVLSMSGVVAALAAEAGVDLQPMDPNEPLRRVPVAGDPRDYVPVDFVADFPPDVLLPDVASIRVGSLPIGMGIEVVTHPDLVDQAEQVAADLIERARGRGSPLHGRVLQPVGGDDIFLAAYRPPTPARDEVVLDDSAWRDVDEVILPLLRSDRSGAVGVLVSGPPGTGKTSLCWAIAAEVAGDVTVLSCGPPPPQGPALADVYGVAATLAPAIVVIENLDLRCSPRGTDDGRALGDLLAGLDAARRATAPVVTLATVIDPSAVDGALRSSAHFDVCIELGLPGPDARAEILARLVDDPTVDVRRTAQVTEGASGADLASIVRHARLGAGGDQPISSEALLRAARRQRPAGDSGLYL